jgi:hypothetical protein
MDNFEMVEVVDKKPNLEEMERNTLDEPQRPKRKVAKREESEDEDSGEELDSEEELTFKYRTIERKVGIARNF